MEACKRGRKRGCKGQRQYGREGRKVERKRKVRKWMVAKVVEGGRWKGKRGKEDG